MFNFLSPRKVGDVNKTIDTFFEFYEYTEISEIANSTCMFRTYWIFFSDVNPRVWGKLFNAQRHFALVAVESQDNSFYFVAEFYEILSRTQVSTPRHFRNVDKTFYTISDFYESTVVGNYHYFTFYFIAYFKVISKSVPRVFAKLF